MTVVSNTEAPTAGSILNLWSRIGIAAPKSPATNKLNNIASAITTPSKFSPNHQSKHVDFSNTSEM